MNKLSIAAFAAASIIGFGAVGSASAAEISGYADVRYLAVEDDDSTSATNPGTGEGGAFTATGELDIMHEANGVTVRADLDLLDILDPAGPTETNILGLAEVEQLNIMFGVPGAADMVSLTAGIFNSPHGMEGQDAPDIAFARQGLIWGAVPSNMAGAKADVKASDMVGVSAWYINSRADITGGVATDRANDMGASVSLAVNEQIGAYVSYQTDESESWGDQIGAYVTADMGQFGGAVEVMIGDPATGSGMLDTGYGINLTADLDVVGVAGRYESVEYEGGVDATNGSVAVSYGLGENTEVRLDYSNYHIDNGISADDVTVQFVSTF